MTKTPFEILKRTRNESFKRILWHVGELDKKETHSRIDAFVQKALRKSRKFRDAEKLKECRRGAYCGSIYCAECRNRMASKLHRRVRLHISTQKMDEDACRDRLRWVTVLHSLECADVANIKQATKRARADYVQLNRRFLSSWAQGAFEFELVDMEKVNSRVSKNSSGTRKKNTLKKLGGYAPSLETMDWSWIWQDKTGNKRSDYILVHTHFLMDCGKEDWRDIEKYMRRRWYKDYQVRIDGLTDFNVRSLDDSLWKMSSYCFKNRCSHHYEFGGYDIDEFEVNENMFSVNELNTVYGVYKAIAGGKNTGLLLGWQMKH